MTVERARNRREMDGAMARGMGWVAFFASVTSGARLCQDIVIAWRFGTGPVVDAYYYLLSLVNWPIAVALSVLTILVAPSAAALRGKGAGPEHRFRSELLGNALVVALGLLPLIWWVLYAITSRAAGGLDAAVAATANGAVSALIWMVPLGLLGALLSAWLVAAGRHALALLEGLPAIVLLALLLAAPMNVLFWGTTLGMATQVLAMALVLRHAGKLGRPRLGFSAEHWQAFQQGAWLLLGAQALFALVPLIDTFLAAQLGAGAVAALSYTNRLVLGLQGLAGLALQRSGLPLLSNLAAHSPDEARHAAVRWAVAAALLGAAIGLFVALLADPLVALLYERGSFTQEDRVQVATLLRYGMLQMPLLLCGMVFITALAAIGARRAVAVVAVVNVTVKTLTSIALVPHYGLVGLLLATALMYAIGATAAWWAWRRILRPHTA